MMCDPVVIWGAGAVGGSIGAWLVRAGSTVTFVDTDDAHAAAIAAHGLRITGPVDDFIVPARCIHPDQAESGMKTVILAVKAHHTGAALERLAPLLASDGFVVSAQNGMNEMLLAQRLGVERTVGCFVNFGADVLGPGSVLRGNRGAVVVGEVDGRVTERARAVHALLRHFEPAAVLTSNIWGYLWAKLAYGSMLFATALTDAPIADVLESPKHRRLLVELAREVVTVAGARGVTLERFDGFDPAAFDRGATRTEAHESLDALARFNRGSGKAYSGVWRDLAVRKRPTEVDALIGPIVVLGERKGVATPLNRRLVGLIHDVEQGRRAQCWETLEALGSPRRRPMP